MARYTYAPGYIDAVACQERDLNDDGDFADSNEVVYYHSTTLHSVYALTNSSESVVERYRFDAYGKVTVLDPDHSADSDNASDVSNPYLYTGRRADSESNLMQYRHRYYSWKLGRFISRDPTAYRGSHNLYEYAGGEPLRRTDPRGLYPLPDPGHGSPVPGPPDYPPTHPPSPGDLPGTPWPTEPGIPGTIPSPDPAPAPGEGDECVEVASGDGDYFEYYQMYEHLYGAPVEMVVERELDKPCPNGMTRFRDITYAGGMPEYGWLPKTGLTVRGTTWCAKCVAMGDDACCRDGEQGECRKATTITMWVGLGGHGEHMEHYHDYCDCCYD